VLRYRPQIDEGDYSRRYLYELPWSIVFVQVTAGHPVRSGTASSPTIDQYVQWAERSHTEGWNYSWEHGWRNTEQAAKAQKDAMDEEEPKGGGHTSKRHTEEEGGGGATGERPNKVNRGGDLELADGTNVHDVPYRVESVGTGQAFVMPKGPPPVPTGPPSAADSAEMRDEYLPKT